MRRWRRRQGLLFVPQVRARDDFTDADGTLLESHRPTSEGSWTKHSASGLGSATIDANRVHNTNDATTHIYYHSRVPATPDYRVEAGVVLVTDNDLGTAGPAARIDIAANTRYHLRYLTGGNVWQVQRVVAGVSTVLGSNIAQTLTVGQRYVAALDLRGAQVVALVNGVPIIAVLDDAPIIAAGRAGLIGSQAATSAIGVHLDSWLVRQ